MPLLFGKYRRFVILVVCIFEMLSMSGILYGWNSLVPVLKKYEVFRHRCPETNGTAYAGQSPNLTVLTSRNGTGESVQIIAKKANTAQTCPEQEQMLSNAFIIGSSFQFVVALPAGMFYDRFGLRVTKITNGVVFFIACLLMGMVSASRSYLVFPGLCLLSIGASFILLTNLQIGSLFPAWQYLIISLYSGGFDSSSIIMQLIQFGHSGGISMMVSFITLGSVGVVVMLFVGFFLFPRKSMLDGESTPKEEPKSPEEAETLNAEPQKNSQFEIIEPELQAEAAPNSMSLKSCVCSANFISQVFWFSCILLRFNFFLTGFFQHLSFRFANNGAVRERLIVALSFFLFMGILIAPFSGFITDFFKKRFAKGGEVTRAVILRALSLSQALTSMFSVVLCALLFAPGEAMFYVCYVAEVLTRAFLFSLNSAYFLTVFPPQVFGKLFGLCFLIGGIFTQIQYALLQLGFIWSNVVLLILTIASFVHPLRLSGVFSRCCS